MRIYDATNPVAPVNVGHAPTPGQYAWSLAVAGNYAFLGLENGINVYDIFNPSQPIQVGQAVTTASVLCLTVSGDYVYAACQTDGFRIFRILPQLQLSIVGNSNVQLTWPSTVAQFTLEQSPDMTTTNWTAVTNAVLVQGHQNQATLSQSLGTAFYRLHQSGT